MLRAVLIAIVLVLLLPYLLTPLYHVVNPVSTLMVWRKMTGERVERVWAPLDRDRADPAAHRDGRRGCALLHPPRHRFR